MGVNETHTKYLCLNVQELILFYTEDLLHTSLNLRSNDDRGNNVINF